MSVVNVRYFLNKISVKSAVITLGIAAIAFNVISRFMTKKSKPSNGPKEGGSHKTNLDRKNGKSMSWRYLNGGLSHMKSSPGSISSRIRNGSASVSLSSDIYSSTSTVNTVIDTNAMSPQQLGLMGMEALETAISYWEDAISAYSSQTSVETFALPSSEEAKFSHIIQKILKESYKLQHKCEQLFLNQGSVLFRSDSMSTFSRDRTISEHDRIYTSMSSIDSFVSAQADIADLRDFDDFAPDVDVQKLAFYQSALDHLEEHGIPYRTFRTEVVNCNSDMDYLVKIHCLRLAFEVLFQDVNVNRWFADIGRQLMTDLLIRAERDPKEFLVAFDNMLEYVWDSSNQSKTMEELQGRGVKCASFYDIMLDFILLDAFEDLESPPSTVIAVIQNRWLSVSFKETALATAVWSVLAAKRRALKYSDGFISHFYYLSEHISPVLAWGFLGPNEELKEICVFFKNQSIDFLENIFNLKKVRYTTKEDLASDVLTEAKQHYEVLHQRLSL